MTDCCGTPEKKEKKWGVKDCRARKCSELQKDPRWPDDSAERCTVFNTMPGTLPCCIKDQEIQPEVVLRQGGWHLLQDWEKGESSIKTPNPGPKNCPEKCPYKFSEMGETFRNVGGEYKKVTGKISRCAFTGGVLGTGDADRCYCHVLGNPHQDYQIKVLQEIIAEAMKPVAKSLECGGEFCPDGVKRCHPRETTCPVIKLPLAEMKVCPFWRIPAKTLPAIVDPVVQEKPATPDTIVVPSPEEVTQKEKTPSRNSSQKEKTPKAKKEKPEPPALNVLYLEDCELLTKRMESESIDIIFTDPPYVSEPVEDGVTQWERAYVALHLIADKVLKPSGFLITYAPQAHLHDIMDLLAYGGSKNIATNESGGVLDYFWIIPSINGGATCKAHKWNALCLHKPILVFQKAPFKSPSKCFADVVRGKKQKSYHAWQQSVHDVLGILSRFMEPGQVVYDPYACTATTLIAGQLLGMKWIGAEIDPKSHAIGVRELQQRPMDLFTFGGEEPEPVCTPSRELVSPPDQTRQAKIEAPVKARANVEPCRGTACLECLKQDECEDHDPHAGCERELKEEIPATLKDPICYCTPCKTWATCTAKPESDECKAHRALYENAPTEEKKGGCTNCGHHKTKKTFAETCTRLKDLMFKGGEYSAARLMAEVEADGCLGWIPKEEAPAKEEKCDIHYYTGKDLSPSLGTCPDKCAYKDAGKSTCRFTDQQFLRMESCPTGVLQADAAGQKCQLENIARALARLSANLPSKERCQCNPCPDGVQRCGVSDENCPFNKNPFYDLALCPMTNPRRVRQIRREYPVKFVSIEETRKKIPQDQSPSEKPNCGGKRPAISRCPDNCPDKSIEKEGGYPQGRCKQTGEKLREMQTCPNDPPKAEKKPGKKSEKPLESVVPFRQFLNEHHEQIVTGKDLPIIPQVVEQYKRFDQTCERCLKLFISDGKFPFGPWWTLSPSGKLRSVKKPTGDLHQGESYPDCRFRFEWHYDDKKNEE